MKKLLVSLLAAVALALPSAVLAQMNTGNLSCTLLPSAVRTTTTAVNSADVQNTVWKGTHVVLNFSTYTSGTFTPTIQGKDPVSGNYYTILVGSGIATSVGSPFILKVYPGITAAVSAATADVLPRVWRISVLGTATPSARYSVGCSLIQ